MREQVARDARQLAELPRGAVAERERVDDREAMAVGEGGMNPGTGCQVHVAQAISSTTVEAMAHTQELQPGSHSIDIRRFNR